MLDKAHAILSRIGDGIGLHPADPTLVSWLWEHNITRGVDTTPIDESDPSRPGDFPRAVVDDGARTDGRRFFSHALYSKSPPPT